MKTLREKLSDLIHKYGVIIPNYMDGACSEPHVQKMIRYHPNSLAANVELNYSHGSHGSFYYVEISQYGKKEKLCCNLDFIDALGIDEKMFIEHELEKMYLAFENGIARDNNWYSPIQKKVLEEFLKV